MTVTDFLAGAGLIAITAAVLYLFARLAASWLGISGAAKAANDNLAQVGAEVAEHTRLEINDQVYILALGGDRAALLFLDVRAGDAEPQPIDGYLDGRTVSAWSTETARLDAAKRAAMARRWGPIEPRSA